MALWWSHILRLFYLRVFTHYVLYLVFSLIIVRGVYLKIDSCVIYLFLTLVDSTGLYNSWGLQEHCIYLHVSWLHIIQGDMFISHYVQRHWTISVRSWVNELFGIFRVKLIQEWRTTRIKCRTINIEYCTSDKIHLFLIIYTVMDL